MIDTDNAMDVLVIENSSVLRRRLVDSLRQIEGINIIGEVSGAEEAITYFNKHKPNLVILDIGLSGGSGIDVLRAIKQGKNPAKIIVMTNYPYPQYRKKCFELGADYFFDKSVNFQDVIKVVSQLVDGNKRERARQSL